MTKQEKVDLILEVREETNQANQFGFRRGDAPTWRVWKSGWAGDQFEILSNEEMVQFLKFTRSFQIGLRFFHGNCETWEDAQPVGWYYNEKDLSLEQWL